MLETMESTQSAQKFQRTLDAKPNDVSIVKPGELVDIVEMTPLTLTDRRIYNLLLANAWEKIADRFSIRSRNGSCKTRCTKGRIGLRIPFAGSCRRLSSFAFRMARSG